MVVEVRFNNGIPHLQLEAAFRTRRGRVDPVFHLLAKTNHLILSGQIRNGIAFLEAAVLEVMRADALDEQSFPLLIRLVMLYEKSGIIKEIRKKDLDAEQQKTLFALLDQASFLAESLAEELNGGEPPLAIRSQLKREISDLGMKRPGAFPGVNTITLTDFLGTVEGLRKIVRAAKIPLSLDGLSVFSGQIAQAFKLQEDAVSREDLVIKLLEIEEQALKGLGTSREEALKRLPDEVREEYIDFLFMLGGADIIVGEFQSAIEIFEGLMSMPSEANSPDILNNLAIAQTCEAERALLNGGGGRELYKQALVNFGRAKRGGSVSKEEVFEAAVYEARAGIGLALLKDPQAPKEDIFALLSPAMVRSQEFAADGREIEMYARGMDKSLQVLDARLAAEKKLETMVYILGQAGQQAGPAQLEDIEAIPVLVRIFLEPVASLVDQQNLLEVARQLGSVNSRAGKRLSSLVLFCAVQNRIGEKGLRAQDEVKRLLAVPRKGNCKQFFFQALVGAAAECQRTVFAELRQMEKEQAAAQAQEADQAAAAAKIAEAKRVALEFMQKLSAGEKVSHTECRDFIGRLKVLGEEGEEIRGQALAAIEQVIRGSSTVEGALILAGLLYQEEADSQDKVKALFTAILEDRTCQDKIFKVIVTVVANLRLGVRSVASGEATEQKMVAGALAQKKVAAGAAKPMKDDANIESEIVMDFICVGIRELEIVQDKYKEIAGVPYAYPVSYLSIWYGLLAPYAKGKERQKVLIRALAEDPENIVAHLELARCTGELGQVEAADALAEKLLEKTTDPVLVVRASLLRLLNILFLLKTQKNKARAPQLLGQAQQVLVRAGQAYEEVGDITFGMVSLKHDWEGMLRAMGLMYDVLNRFEPAMEYFNLALESNPHYEQAVVGKTLTLFKQGGFVEAVEFLTQAVQRDKDKEEHADYYYHLAEAFMRMGKFKEAREQVAKVLIKTPAHFNFQLLDARIIAVAASTFGADLMEAEQKLARCQGWAPELFAGLSSTVLINELRGSLALTEGEVLAAQGKREEALAKLRRAAAYFEGSQFSMYQSICTSWRAADLSYRWAMRDRKSKPGQAKTLYDQVVQQARGILEANPSFSLARETLIGALIDLEREAETLPEFQYLIDSGARITVGTIMNLIILAFANSTVTEEARELVFALKAKAPAEDFTRAKEVVIESDPGLDLSALGPS